MQTYNEAAKKLKEVSVLGGISGLLGWDEVRLQMHALALKGMLPFMGFSAGFTTFTDVWTSHVEACVLSPHAYSRS
eukprot:549719-Pelagomonas_calceolata.AAC.2